MANLLSTTHSRKPQAGLTLIEFMVAIVIGMLLVAAISTLIANQSANRSEVDRAGKLIENGRFALNAMASDVQMAGYWGELSGDPTAPANLPQPCNLTVAGLNPTDSLESAMGMAIQGYDSPATLPPGPGTISDCVKNHKPGTDILVVRKVDPDTSAIQSGGNMDLSKLTPGQVYVQTGLDTAASLTYKIAASNPGTDTATFTLTKKEVGGVKPVATLRKYVVHIYYISQCSVEVGGSCTGADGGNPIPTLKRVELRVAAGNPSMTCPDCRITIAEGIEDMQIDYGRDTDGDGMPNGTDLNGSAPAFTVADWANVMSLRIYLLARGTELTPGHTDNKTYALGSAGAASAANDGYKRHVFTQSVRLVNPSARRSK